MLIFIIAILSLIFISNLAILFSTLILKAKEKIYFNTILENYLDQEKNLKPRRIEFICVNEGNTDFVIQGVGIKFKHHFINFVNFPYLLHPKEVYRISLDAEKVLKLIDENKRQKFKFFLKNNRSKIYFASSKNLRQQIKKETII